MGSQARDGVLNGCLDCRVAALTVNSHTDACMRKGTNKHMMQWYSTPPFAMAVHAKQGTNSTELLHATCPLELVKAQRHDDLWHASAAKAYRMGA